MEFVLKGSSSGPSRDEEGVFETVFTLPPGAEASPVLDVEVRSTGPLSIGGRVTSAAQYRITIQRLSSEAEKAISGQDGLN